MDPRLKAYQKQARPVTAVEEPQAGTLPVVRAPQLPRFDSPLVKTTVPDQPKPKVREPVREPVLAPGLAGDKSLRKVAKFLILLGQDEAAKVVRHLDPAQVEALGREIAGIRKIEPVEAEAILQEFGYIATAQTSAVKGGKGTAQAILFQAFGDAKAKKILQKAVPQAGEKPFAFFRELDKETVAALLGSESPPVLSIVVPFLGKAQAAVFLKALDPVRRLDLVKRLAKMEKVPSTVVAQVDQSLRERFHALNPAHTEAVDGKARLADILRHMSSDKEESILRSLGESKPGLSDDLRKRLFTAADLVRVGDEGFEELLRAKEDAQVALVWLAGDSALKAKVQANISARRWLLVQAEADLLADTSQRELQKEMRFFLDEVRQAVREGRASLLDDAEEYV